MKELEVIGLSGKLKTGKDYIATHYFQPLGYHNISLAWHFKIWLIGQGKATYEQVFETKPPEIRKLLQEEGTERGRNVYGQNVWVDTTFAWINLYHQSWGLNKFVIPDVRFRNEVEAIKQRGGKVFRIVAPERDANSGASPEARAHISETDLDSYPLIDYDGLIFNNPQHSETVGMQVRLLLGDSPIVFGTTATDGEEDDEIRLFEKIGSKLDAVGDELERLGNFFLGRK